MRVRGFGIDADLPRGWEASLRNTPLEAPGRTTAPGEAMAMAVSSAPVLHAGTFPLPVERGDFGSGAVEVMTHDDTFVALLEYDEEEVGTALFARQGMPRRLDPRRFTGRSLQRVLPGQAGFQEFFTEGGRAFCLYVVLGAEEDKLVQVRRVEQMLASIVIEPRVPTTAPIDPVAPAEDAVPLDEPNGGTAPLDEPAEDTGPLDEPAAHTTPLDEPAGDRP